MWLEQLTIINIYWHHLRENPFYESEWRKVDFIYFEHGIVLGVVGNCWSELPSLLIISGFGLVFYRVVASLGLLFCLRESSLIIFQFPTIKQNMSEVGLSFPHPHFLVNAPKELKLFKVFMLTLFSLILLLLYVQCNNKWIYWYC